ncbi:MAG: transcription-repair coupling factor [Oscillospiraceae bacterium]|nr:transcription-repair coupling factor [Oscillospiraceae bacterium]
MNFFTDTFEELSDWKRLTNAVESGEVPVCVTGLSLIHKAQLLLTAAKYSSEPVLVLTGSEAEAVKLCADINAMAGDVTALYYPAKEMLFTSAESKSFEYEHERLHVLSAVMQKKIKIIAVGIEAALQPVIPPEILMQSHIMLKQGDLIDLKALTEKFIRAGYIRCETVEGKGQFAIRGAIIDIYPVQAEQPVRMELWGDEIDSISYFDTDSQRRTEQTDSVMISPASELLYHPEELKHSIQDLHSKIRGKYKDLIQANLLHDIDRIDAGLQIINADKYYSLIYDNFYYLTDYVSGLMILSEYPDIHRHAQALTAQRREDLQLLYEQGILCRNLPDGVLEFSEFQSRTEKQSSIYLSQFLQGSERIPFRKIISMEAMQNATWGGEIRQLLEDLQEYTSHNYRVVLAVGSEKTLPILVSDLQESGIRCSIAHEDDLCPPGAVLVTAKSISGGFSYPENKTALIVQTKMHSSRKRRHKHKAGMEIQTLSDLHTGDLVVHAMHGVGRFLGIHKLEMEGITKDYITIQYAGTEKLYVPVTQLDLVSRYIGAQDEGSVKLNRLSSPQWQKTCSNVRKAVRDMAEELMKLYAKREKSQGYAFYPDDEIQHRFEERFPYAETDDQLQSIGEIKADMERPRPMDRLLCGDVGFGKTEVAFRAAMKCVLSDRQCAILAPTTVLALQHYRTALQRFDQMPVRIEMLSRFRTPKEQKKILEDLEKGKIDIIIGTHRIVQKDVKFHALGLAVIDEEQRFGVAHKEKFKEIFAGIDVLTLSATPIPRTLNMALSGIRDMSVLADPPQDRYPVQTYVTEYQEGIIMQAISRELKRGGQVYYIHNRIDTIQNCAARIQNLFPEARIAIAHGRLSEEEMSDIWQSVVENEIDILVCTTIIETGVDVANVNTLIIEDSDRLGLSQLYQLRGRVGRSNRRAYAYFLFKKDKVLTEIAAKRLEAMREFTQFGSGFRIAMRDLEIRGAGSILGGQQHGHMETVGYDMYMQMLNEAIAEVKGEKIQKITNCTVDIQIEAYIPEDYIQTDASRIDMYRKIATVRDENDESELIDELIDRYGEPPKAMLGLIKVSLLRNSAAAMGITEITQRNGTLQFYIQMPENEQIAALSAKYSRRILYSCTGKPFIGVKLLPYQTAAALMQEVIFTMRDAVSRKV